MSDSTTTEVELERAEEYENQRLLGNWVNYAWVASVGNGECLVLLERVTEDWRATFKARFIRGRGEDMVVVEDAWSSSAMSRRVNSGSNFHRGRLVDEESKKLLKSTVMADLQDPDYMEDVDEVLQGLEEAE